LVEPPFEVAVAVERLMTETAKKMAASATFLIMVIPPERLLMDMLRF
jgi:hypothetical protein